jgi:hypothetical protein
MGAVPPVPGLGTIETGAALRQAALLAGIVLHAIPGGLGFGAVAVGRSLVIDRHRLGEVLEVNDVAFVHVCSRVMPDLVQQRKAVHPENHDAGE